MFLLHIVGPWMQYGGGLLRNTYTEKSIKLNADNYEDATKEAEKLIRKNHYISGEIDLYTIEIIETKQTSVLNRDILRKKFNQRTLPVNQVWGSDSYSRK